ncbi:hypothetical protein SUGI_0943060 [Cryptomeria japonica]|uniref:uncharacterized protein LOC131079681 n=1 Tax=Cryptomeria japonica TaxID=3369 RepID=UPI002414B824|nr:uncharacterized protein LOC131079681 [Cryptomeria japonica]XP_057873682.2 uncharacterized protein LOC131079681 [Cryptomeria japonica]XP_057873683.2 uncharacterized protein LOC131079681 [Cryptomeria japonica]GLJ44830.1 hypothetical protein SUGI_0943060 [Cryptomeria japonica]
MDKFPFLGFMGKPPISNTSKPFNGVEHATVPALGLEAQGCDRQLISMNGSGDFISFPSSPKGTKRKYSSSDLSGSSSAMFSLALGLGPSTSSSDSKANSGTSSNSTSCKENTEEESSVDLELGIQLHLGNAKNNSPKKNSSEVAPKMRDMDSGSLLQLSLSRGPTESGKSCVLTEFDCALGLGQAQNEIETVINMNNIPVVDEGSTSARWKSGGYIPSLLMAKTAGSRFPSSMPSIQRESDPSVSIKGGNLAKSSLSNVSGITEKKQRTTSSKTCQFKGCGKGARGASGLCIAHGGGRRCQKAGCNKGAEGRTVYCKAHGGGRRCQHLGCTKSAEGRTDYCIGHGGGRRCSNEGCDRAARGKSGLCIKHGGGKRCTKEGCTKSAEGYSGLCISHGGGRRCQYTSCTKGAQGSTMFCKAHGGGKRCIVTGCNKGAEGSTPLCKGHGGGKRCLFEGGGICPKSVHGGTKFCVAHGGGKRCAVQGCTKSARGRTDFCVRHGGGKRCKFEGCGKSAQGSTDFCKAHGGGKRCLWGAEGSPYAKEIVQGKSGEIVQGPCDRFARGKTGLCAAHSALVQDGRVHGAGTLAPGIGPGLFRGLASASTLKGFNASCPNPPANLSLPQFGRNVRSEFFVNSASESPNSIGASSAATFNLEQNRNNAVNDVDMVEFREKNMDGLEDKLPLSSIGSDERHTNTLGVEDKGYPAFWAFSQPFLPTVDGNGNVSLGGSVIGRRVGGHYVGPSAPVVGLHAELGSGSSLPRLGRGVHQPLLPPQVLVPLSMKNTLQMEKQSSSSGISENNSLSLPEGRVHGGGLMAMLSRGSGIGDAGRSVQGEQNRMFEHASWC